LGSGSFFAVDARKAGNKDGLELHGIEMAPLLLGSVIIDVASVTAFRARYVLSCIGKADYHLLTKHGQINILDFPG